MERVVNGRGRQGEEQERLRPGLRSGFFRGGKRSVFVLKERSLIYPIVRENQERDESSTNVVT